VSSFTKNSIVESGTENADSNEISGPADESLTHRSLSSSINTIKYESLIAINSLPVEITTFDEHTRQALTRSVDKVLRLPPQSSVYLGDSIFSPQQSDTTNSETVTLISHVYTTVSLAEFPSMKNDATKLFYELRNELSNAVASGELLQLIKSECKLPESTTIDSSITAINLEVVPSTMSSIESQKFGNEEETELAFMIPLLDPTKSFSKVVITTIGVAGSCIAVFMALVLIMMFTRQEKSESPVKDVGIKDQDKSATEKIPSVSQGSIQAD